MDFLDSLSVGLEADETSGYQPHPCGTFKAVVTDVKQREYNFKPLWDFTIKTAVGTVVHGLWGFSDTDMAEAKNSQEARERMLATVKRHKRFLVDMGVATVEQAKAMPWSQMVGSWVHCIGKRCQVVVKPNQKKPGYTTTFVNAFEDVPDVNEGTLPPPPKDARAVGNSASGGYSTSQLKPPGSDGMSLDQIPF